VSQENVEIVRAAFEAWNAGRMDAVKELYDPDATSQPPKGWPESEPAVGREAVSDFTDAGDRVAVRYNWHGVGHGPELNMAFTCVCTVCKGKIFRVEFFWDHAEALETLGLAE